MPEEGRDNPARILRNVVFPAPFLLNRAMHSPRPRSSGLAALKTAEIFCQSATSDHAAVYPVVTMVK
jgi:hypothetical protein